MAKCKHISIEIEQHPGQWVGLNPHADDNVSQANNVDLALVAPVSSVEADVTAPLEEFMTLHADLSDHVDYLAPAPTFSPFQLPHAAPLSPTDVSLSGTFTDQCYRVDGSNPWDMASQPVFSFNILFQPSPYYQMHLGGQSHQVQSGGQLRRAFAQFRANSNPGPSMLAFYTPEKLLTSLLQDVSASHPHSSLMNPHAHPELPSVQDLVDRLESLLPPVTDEASDSIAQDASTITTQSRLEDTLADVFLYSVLNGFAGFRDVPIGSVFKLLRSHPQLNCELFAKFAELEDSSSLKKSLAENLLRAAVEACDAEAIQTISQMTKGRLTEMHPDTILCEYEGQVYTALEFAAKKRHKASVEVLLTLGADVKKTYAMEPPEEQGPLELALQISSTVPQPIDLAFVKMLLQAGCKIRAESFKMLVRRSPDSRLHEVLMEGIEQHEHTEIFEVLEYLVSFMSNNLATGLVKKIRRFCHKEGCFRCIPSTSSRILKSNETVQAKCLRKILARAAIRGNMPLCKFLLDYVESNGLVLAAAIRGGDEEIVNLMTEHGASVQDEVGHLELNYGSGDKERRFTSFSTPLSEAILSQNPVFMELVQQLGAWECLEQFGHLHGAIEACVDANDSRSLARALLCLADCGRVPMLEHHFNDCLVEAIRQNESTIAIMLLEAGAPTYDTHISRHKRQTTNSLTEALRLKNKAIVDFLLDCAVSLSPVGDTAMAYAVRWGNISVVWDLLALGLGMNERAKTQGLAEAIKTDHAELIDLFLKNKTDPNLSVWVIEAGSVKLGNSPLREAANKGDAHMVRRLLRAGADAADESAFASAMALKEGDVLEILASALRCQHPAGRKGFGAGLLIKAIQDDDITLLNVLLGLKIDVHSFSSKHGCTPIGAALRSRESNSMIALQSLLQAGVDVEYIATAPLGLGEKEERYKAGPFPRQTALVEAVVTRDKSKIKLILEHGADVNRPARRGLKRTPLQKACELGSYPIVKMLLDQGAETQDVATVSGGGTALQLASGTGSFRIVQLLLAKGADVHAPKSRVHGRTALENAAENGCLDIVKMLWDATNYTGFPNEEVQRAMAFAKRKGYRGCAQYVSELQMATQKLLTEPTIA